MDGGPRSQRRAKRLIDIGVDQDNMARFGKMIGGGLASLAALGLLLAPAVAAPGQARKKARSPRVSLIALGGLGSFTPAVADPRLAAAFARRGASRAEFSFTPSATRRDRRAVRVAIRARAATSASRVAMTGSGAGADVSPLAPTAYNLGVAVGYKRFAVSGDVAKLDTGLAPGGREAAEVGISYNLKDFTGRVQVGADRTDARTPRLVANDINYSLDVGGSYKVARNLELTGGVRYKIESDRLAPLADTRRDSQAVYVGTAFKF